MTVCINTEGYDRCQILKSQTMCIGELPAFIGLPLKATLRQYI